MRYAALEQYTARAPPTCLSGGYTHCYNVLFALMVPPSPPPPPHRLTFADSESVDAALAHTAVVLGGVPKVSVMDSMADASNAVMPDGEEEDRMDRLQARRSVF